MTKINIDSATLERWSQSCRQDIEDMKRYGKKFCVYCRSGDLPGCYCEVITVQNLTPEK